MLQGFEDIVEPMDTFLVTAERRYETKNARSCKMKPKPRNKLRSRKTTTKDVVSRLDLGIGRVGTMMINPDDQ